MILRNLSVSSGRLLRSVSLLSAARSASLDRALLAAVAGSSTTTAAEVEGAEPSGLGTTAAAAFELDKASAEGASPPGVGTGAATVASEVERRLSVES